MSESVLQTEPCVQERVIHRDRLIERERATRDERTKPAERAKAVQLPLLFIWAFFFETSTFWEVSDGGSSPGLSSQVWEPVIVLTFRSAYDGSGSLGS